MGTGWAFDWWPGGLAWLLVMEVIALVTMAVFRWVAGMLGRDEPTDFFVIFYRTFWRAMKNPRLYPVPVNYQPVPPRKPKQVDPDEEVEDLTEDEIETLLAGGGGNADEATGGGDDAGLGGTRQALLEIRVVGPADRDEVRGFDGETLLVGVTVAPDDGRANAAAINMVCRILRLEHHQVSITAGHTRPDKTLRISGITPAELDNRRSDLSAAAVADDPFTSEPSVGFRDD